PPALLPRPARPGLPRPRLAVAQRLPRGGRVALAAQAPEPGEAMRTVSLLCVLVLAKLATLIGQPVPLSAWTPFAYFWQDLVVVLLFAALDALTRRRPWVGWTVYGAIVLYAAVNVPVARVMSTPLTWPMLRAVGGPLGDSIAHHATPLNIALLLLVVAAGAGCPWLFRRVRPR